MNFSRVKTVVHPDYAYLEDFVRRLPQEEFPIDHVFCDRRNTVVATHEQGIPMVVKKYARPTVFNCFIYTFFRPTKAKRAYRYAMRLERCGVETAVRSDTCMYIGGEYSIPGISFAVIFLTQPLHPSKDSMKLKSNNFAMILLPLQPFFIAIN